MVEPVDSSGGRVFDFLDGAPGVARFDEFGFVQAVDGHDLVTTRQAAPGRRTPPRLGPPGAVGVVVVVPAGLVPHLLEAEHQVDRGGLAVRMTSPAASSTASGTGSSGCIRTTVVTTRWRSRGSGTRVPLHWSQHWHSARHDPEARPVFGGFTGTCEFCQMALTKGVISPQQVHRKLRRRPCDYSGGKAIAPEHTRTTRRRINGASFRPALHWRATFFIAQPLSFDGEPPWDTPGTSVA